MENKKIYVMAPSVEIYDVYIVKGDENTILLELDEENEEGKVSIKQVIKDGKLSTDIEYLNKHNEVDILERSHIEVTVKKDTKLVYIENKGYVVTTSRIVTVDEAIEDLNVLKDIQDNLKEGKEDET